MTLRWRSILQQKAVARQFHNKTLRQKQFEHNNFSSTREDAPSGEGLSTTKPWESLALHQVEVFVAIHMIGLAAGGLSIGLVGGLASEIGLAV